MEIRADARIPWPRDIVFAAYRDDIIKALPFLSNVRGIDVKSRKEDGPLIEVVNDWRGGGEIPAALRMVLSESALVWTDYATWDSRSFSCDWRTSPRALAEAMNTRGRSAYLEDGPGKTLIQVRGSLDVDAKKIRGVPGFLASTIGRAAEDFLVSKIQANLAETAKGVTRYLEERGAG